VECKSGMVREGGIIGQARSQKKGSIGNVDGSEPAGTEAYSPRRARRI
jgi:hypothetical protein